MKPTVVASRFRLERLLKNGQGIETWLAEDRLAGGPAVVKRASTSASAWLRLAHHADVLRALPEQSFSRVRWLGREGAELILATDYIPGTTLQDRLQSGPLTPEHALDVVERLLELLELVHERGVLHRDVKPSNLVLGPAGPALIDFGLSRSARLQGTIRDLPVGSVLYMAPESAGLVKRAVGEPADLYSTGVLLFQCLTGQVPFHGGTVQEVLRKHVCEPIPTPRELPRGLRLFLERLLAKDPLERYPEARVARLDLQRIRQGQPPAAVVRPGRLPSELPLIGRQEHLESLDGELARAIAGSGGLTLVEAPSGGGKTRLLEEFAVRAMRSGARVLRGNASENVPLGLFSGVVHDLFQLHPAQSVASMLGTAAADLVNAFPSAGEWLQASPSTAPEQYGPERTRRVLGLLLNRLGTAEQPAVVLLDDAQWADELSLEVVRLWSQRRPQRHVQVIMAARSDLVGVDRMAIQLRLRLAPLTPAQSAHLAQSLLAGPKELGDYVHEATAGNPFLVTEVLRGLSEQPDLSVASAGDLQASRRGAAMLVRHLRELDPRALAVLRVAAVAGRTFEVQPVAHASGEDPGYVLEVLEQAARRHLVWGDRSDIRFSLAHDRLRDALLEELDPAERRRLHARLAEVLDPARVFDVAHHFSQAGEGERAYPFLTRAARQARQSFDLEAASRFYGLALEVRPNPVLREELGQVLQLRGRYADADHCFAQAMHAVEDLLDQARLETQRALLAHLAGRPKDSERFFRNVLDRLGEPFPSKAGLLAVVASEVVCYKLGRFFFESDPPQPAPARTSLIMKALDGLAELYFHNGRLLDAFGAILLSCRWARRCPGSDEAHRVLSQFGGFLNFSLKDVPTMRRCMAQAVHHFARSQSTWELGRSLTRGSIGWLDTSPAPAALAMLETGSLLLQDTGDVSEQGIATYLRGLLLLRVGRFAEVAQAGRELFEDASSLADPRSQAMGLILWAFASGGDVPAGTFDQLAPTEHGMDRLQTGIATALYWLFHGDPVRALRCALVQDTRSGPPEDMMAATVRAQTCRHLAERLPGEAAQLRRRFLEWGYRQLQARFAYARRCMPLFLSPGLREAARLAACLGDPESGRAYLREALALSSRLQHDYEAAACRLELARLERGNPGGEAAFSSALLELEGMGAFWHAREEESLREETELSLADRFDQVLVWGRKLASTLDESELDRTLREGALNLLRAQECRILRRGDEGDYSRSLVQQAWTRRRPVISDESTSSDSLLLTAARSALAAPVIVSGQAEACIYLVHSSIQGLFTPDDAQVADFLGTLAGAALENARGLQDRLRVYRELTESEDRFRSLFRSAAVGLAVVDSEDRILEANTALCELFGCQDLTGQIWTRFLHPLDAARLDPEGDCEVRYLTREGQVRWARLTSTRVAGVGLRTLADISHQRMELLAKFQDDERRLLAAEIHDGLSQPLAALFRKLELMSLQVDHAQAEVCRRLAHSLVEEVSDLIRRLRNPVGEGQGLVESIGALLDGFVAETGLQLDRAMDERLPPAPAILAAACYRLFQEALSNVRRHSGATHVRVALSAQDGWLLGTVSDNGSGFDPERVPREGGRHYGLPGMRLRADMLGGSVAVESNRAGTRVDFRLPL